jgi:hypothetical protein
MGKSGRGEETALFSRTKKHRWVVCIKLCTSRCRLPVMFLGSVAWRRFSVHGHPWTKSGACFLERCLRSFGRISPAADLSVAPPRKDGMPWQAVHPAAPQPDGMAAPSSAPPSQASVSAGRSSARDQSAQAIRAADTAGKTTSNQTTATAVWQWRSVRIGQALFGRLIRSWKMSYTNCI